MRQTTGIAVTQSNALEASVKADACARPTRTRWWMLALFSLMYLISYLDRGVISVAEPEIRAAFGLSLNDMGWVLAAFTWAYALGQIPAAWLGDRFGPKKVLSALLTWTSLAALMTGGASGIVSLFGARLFLGIGEAGAFPVATRGMHLWFPASERGRIQGITHFFSRFAVAITPPLAGAIMLALGWRAVFYVLGVIGLLWTLVFFIVYRDLPEEHPAVNDAELARIRGVRREGSMNRFSTARQTVPWGAICRSRNMWFIALAYCCFFFGTNFYLTWYPTYLREHRGLTIAALGMFGSLPLFAGMLGDVIGGSLTDLLLKRTGRPTLARRAVAAPGFLLAGVFLVPAAVTESTVVSILCLALSFFFLEWVIGPAWAVPMDVGGPFSGTVTGVMVMAGALAASLTPLVYGGLFDQGFWVAPFFVSAGVLVAGAVVWTFLIDPERSVVNPT